MTVFLQDQDATLWHGDCLDVLRTLPERSVHMCATSPPFWSLRDYGNDGQIGLEPTVDEWVERLCNVFDEVRRILRDDGTCWIEVGDSFAGGGYSNHAINGPEYQEAVGDKRRSRQQDLKRANPTLKPKDLVGQPWRLAFALQARGWFLRSEIIWAREPRPNPMPESVRDRPTKAHSTVFLLSKRKSYYYDADAIREEYRTTSMPGRRVNETHHYGADNGGNTGLTGQLAAVRDRLREANRPQAETLDGSAGESPRGPDGRRQTAVKGGENSEQHRNGERWPGSGANARSVWTIATEPTPFAHFATWPQKLVARMILAGTSERGVCPECGAPWTRDIDLGELVGTDRGGNRKGQDVGPFVKNNPGTPGLAYERKTLGWSPSCDCGESGLRPHKPVPATVLDCFAGSGTTLLVARHHGRHSIGVELNAEYCALAASRLAQQSLLTGAA